MLNPLSGTRLKTKKVLTAIGWAFAIILIIFSAIAINKENVEVANREIQNVVIEYFDAMNQQDFDKMKETLYPPVDSENNKEFTSDIKAKMDGTGVEHVILKKIYPVLVDGNIAVSTVIFSTQRTYYDNPLEIREMTTMMFRKRGGKWYIAKPQDLLDYNEDYLKALLDRYASMTKENKAYIEAMKQANESAYKSITSAKK